MPKLSTALLVTTAMFALAPMAAQAQGQRPPLPDGNGKALVENLCTLCHQTNMITASLGYTKADWKELIGTMIDLSPSPDMHEMLTDYLAQHFPPNTRRAPTLVSGPVQITWKEWVNPQLGQRSRDPVQGPDGMIWWVGQFGNVMGRLNPATGEMREFPLPPNAYPHSVEIDRKGNAWFTGNKNGTLGYLDPNTGKFMVFKMPDPNAKDPHTMIFDNNGIGWFTLQNSNMVGRIDPETGDVKLKTVPTPNSKPYGIKLDADKNVYFSCNGAPCLYKITTANFELSEIKLPLEGTTVRRLDIAEDGIVWYVNSSLGRLGRYNPKTGDIKEWPSPSGPKSHPYAIVVVDGIVWYNESGMRPDPLVRFDPKTETFQSWAIPSGNIYAGIIRHMRAAKDGSLLIHQSSTNRIMQVMVQRRAAAR
jgi:virginiamycin B lyase